MKATVEMFNNRWYVSGLVKPNRDIAVFDNGKPTYELFYLHSFSGKNYATKENAIKAIAKHGMEYVDAQTVNLVCVYD